MNPEVVWTVVLSFVAGLWSGVFLCGAVAVIVGNREEERRLRESSESLMKMGRAHGKTLASSER